LAGALAVDAVPTPVDRSLAVAEAAGHDTGSGHVRIGGTLPYAPRTRVLPPPQGDDPRLRLLSLTGALVAHQPPTVVYPADAVEAADVLLAFLARHGYVNPGATTGTAPAEGTA
jgi:electron transfer flavoprotein beta subunit